MRGKCKVISRYKSIFEFLGITLSILGLVAAIIFLVLSIVYIGQHSTELPVGLLIGFMISQIFFNMGIMFYLGYIHGKLG